MIIKYHAHIATVNGMCQTITAVGLGIGMGPVLFQNNTVLFQNNTVLFQNNTVLFHNNTVLFQNNTVLFGNDQIIDEIHRDSEYSL